MLKISQLYSKLQRTTNSGYFIPQIDGLRFFAILPVVVAHLNLFVASKTSLVFIPNSLDYWLSYIINNSAKKGVFLFFVISGFILAIPFAKQFLYDGKFVSLKNYFLRRLTRLEVPYIFSNIGYAILLVLFASHEYVKLFPVDTILSHLGASLLYLHNIIFSDHVAINYVTWSLEIEIQFYILVPLLVLIFRLPKFFRRIILLSLIFLFPFLQHYYTPQFLSIYNFIQYFLIGFILVDLYLSDFKIKTNKIIDFLVGLFAVIGILYLDIKNNVCNEYIFIVLLMIFCSLVLMGNFWKNILSKHFITIVGGMCYSIYLWHTAVISGIGNIITSVGFSDHYVITLLIQMMIVLPSILVVATLLYIFIEKPCMNKDWPINLWNFLINKFKN